MGTASLQYQYAQGGDDGLAREALVLQHLPLVRMIAKRIHERCPPNISLDDLISTGVIGLMDAIDSFDPSFSAQLRTYAERRIRGAILDGMRQMDWVPRETRKRARLIESAIHAAKQRLGREPSDDEIAAELRITPDEYWSWLSNAQAIHLQPLEYVTADGIEISPLRFISDEQDDWPSNLLERAELERVLALAIERMPKMERTILNLYYYEELCLSEIAQIVGLHLSRIAQLRAQAILRLRSHLKRVWSAGSRRRQ